MAAELVLSDPLRPDRVVIATGPWVDGALPRIDADGVVSHRVWHLPAPFDDPALLSNHLQQQLDEQGFDLLFSCVDRSCGGFDFRYALPVAEAPAMHVDLGDFRYLAARRQDPDGARHVSAILSRGGQVGYVHLIEVAPANAEALVTSGTRMPDPPAAVTAGADLSRHLLTHGHAVLDDLMFETGASALSGNQYASLIALSDYLSTDPARRVVLVGHTDAEGSLDANIALSRARAAAVRQFLITQMGANPAQLIAEGIGYLAPRAPNTTPEGRQANRRVEAVVLD